MKILVLNAGSSSLKYQLNDMESEKVLAKGNADRIGIDGSFCKHKKDGGEEIVKNVILKDHKDAIEVIMSLLVDSEQGCIKSMDEIGAVGHRVVASGEYFTLKEAISPMTQSDPLKVTLMVSGETEVTVSPWREAMSGEIVILGSDDGLSFPGTPLR